MVNYNIEELIKLKGCGDDEVDYTLELIELAGSGDSEAQYNLGIFYDQGIVVEEDNDEAVKWYKLASGQGHLDATLALSVKYFTGEGVKEDYVKAFNLCNKVAQKGHAKEVSC